MALWATGQTLNIMTLGGLALAVGILVDDATVTIENINWHLEHGKGVYDAIMDGARQITQPAFVSLLCICVAFVPMFSLQGVAGFLFVPMALAVVFAMIASFILSRTLVPTLALYLLKPHAEEHAALGNNMFARLQKRFENGFADMREGYRNLLALAMTRRRRFVFGFLAAVAVSMLLVPFLGAGLLPLAWIPARSPCMPAPPPAPASRTPPRSSPRSSARSAASFRARELATIVDNIGLNQSPINMIYNNTGTVGPAGCRHLHHPERKSSAPPPIMSAPCAKGCRGCFPAVTFSFPPPDITSQILNFGAPGAAGRAGHRHRPRRDRGLRPAHPAPDPHDSRPGGCAHAAVQQPAAAARSMPTAAAWRSWA